MMRCHASIHSLIIVALVVLMMVAGNSTLAQKLGSDGAPNPTASAMTEQQLLQQSPRIEGNIDQPIERARVLIQPAGRAWDFFHQVTLRWIGAIIILGMIAVLAAAYFVMGRIRISAGRSGKTIPRFNSFERFAHWLTAVSFVILGLTGLNITFGRITLLPLIGPDAFSRMSQIAKYLHNYVSASFVIGLVLIAMDQGQHSSEGRCRLDPAGWRLHQIKTCAGWPLQRRREAGVLVRPRRGSGGYRLRRPPPLSVLRDEHRGDANRAGRSRRDRRSVRCGYHCSYLHRNARHGGRLRGHGDRRSGSQLGKGTSRHLARRAVDQGAPRRSIRTIITGSSGMSTSATEAVDGARGGDEE